MRKGKEILDYWRNNLITVNDIKKNPYEKITYNHRSDKFDVSIQSEYRGELDVYIIEITGTVNGSIQSGFVDMVIREDQLLNEGKIFFKDLLVPSGIGNQGLGHLLMETVFKIAYDFVNFYNLNTKIAISGWLSRADYENENWKISLPFYQSVAKKEELEVVFQCRKTGLQYKSAEEYLANAASEDGDIIYFLR